MNRRAFLGLCAAAPLAGLSIGRPAVHLTYMRGISGVATVGIAAAGETILTPQQTERTMTAYGQMTACECVEAADGAQALHPIQAITDAPIVPFDPPSADQIAYTHERAAATRVNWEPASARRTIVAFTGLAGSGKSTAAGRLVNDHGYQRVRFAGPLKDMLRALGLTEAEIEGDRKEMPCELLCGQTPRRAMQTIGTEWGRDLIGDDLWIRAWRASLDRVPAGVPVVVDDCRFPNEAKAVRDAGGLLIRIDRPGAGAGAAGHVSEMHALPVDVLISNYGSVGELIGRVDQFAKEVEA